MLNELHDHSDPRDWLRPWRDPPGFFLGNCPCCSSSAQMYSLGGTTGTSVVTANKTDFGTETTSAVSSANLSQARYGAGAVGNPAVAAYISGGVTTAPTQVATGDKLNMSNDTTAAQTSANLSLARAEVAGISERSSKGYFGGGYTGTGGSPTERNTGDKIVFSTDTTAAQASANLSTARGAVTGMSEGTSKGYWGGGNLNNTTSTAIADKITFSGDTTSAQTSANLSVVRDSAQAGGDGSTHGYWVGGENSSNGALFNGYDKLTFSNDTTSTLTKNLQRWAAAWGSDGNKLFILGGNDNLVGTTNLATKITFSNDTTAALGTSGNLSQARYYVAGVTTVGL